MKFQFTYNSIYEYLDAVLPKNATDADVVLAKKTYRKLYNSAMKVHRRRVLKHITLSLSKVEHQRLQCISKQRNLSLYDYIRHASLNPNPALIPQNLLNQIEQGILELWDVLEEAEENGVELESINDKLENLERTIQKLKIL